jgi:hypothetical protein
MVCVAADGRVVMQVGTVPAAETVKAHNGTPVSVSVYVTVPVGSVAPTNAGLITAAKVILWFTSAEVGSAVKVTVVVGALTT